MYENNDCALLGPALPSPIINVVIVDEVNICNQDGNELHNRVDLNEELQLTWFLTGLSTSSSFRQESGLTSLGQITRLIETWRPPYLTNNF